MATNFANGTITSNGSEQTIFDVSGDLHFATWIFTHNMTSSDVVVFKVYSLDQNTSTMRLFDTQTLSGVQSNPSFYIPFLPCKEYKVTIQRTAGTDRAYTWLRVEVAGETAVNGVLASQPNTWTGSQSMAALLNIANTLQISGDISPSQITSDQNNYNPSGLSNASVVMLDADSSFRTITGLQGGADGRIIILHNMSNNTILLAHQNGSSTSTNRFDFGGYDLPLFPSAQVTLYYDNINFKWRREGPQIPVIPPPRLGTYNHVHFVVQNPYPFSSAAASGGSISNFNAAGIAKHTGVLRYTLGTSTSGSANMWVNTTRFVLLGNSCYARYEMILKVLQLSNVTDRYTLRVGFISSGTAEGADGAFFRYTDNVNSGKWERVTRNNSVETTNDTGIAAQTSTFVRLSVIVNPAGTNAEFFIDGTSVGSNTTNIPTGGAGRSTAIGFMFLKSAGTTDSNVIDLSSAEVINYLNNTN